MEEEPQNLPDGDLPETSVTETAPETSFSGADGWYILDESGQHMGPYDAQVMEGTLSSTRRKGIGCFVLMQRRN